MQEAEGSFVCGSRSVNLSAKDQVLFWSKVEKTASCWIWKGRKNPAGYGVFETSKQRMFAHRTALALSLGSMPKGLLACHKCDNPPCCNPEHLFLGTHLDNMRDCVSKGRLPRRSGASHWTALREHDSFKGEKNPNSKLSAEEVLQIRKLHAEKNSTQKKLARDFGVSANQINLIVRRLGWTSI